jgi:hypothetical protein
MRFACNLLVALECTGDARSGIELFRGILPPFFAPLQLAFHGFADELGHAALAHECANAPAEIL